MAYRDLQEFVGALEGLGELRRIAVEVDTHLEVAEITDRMSKRPNGGAALLFERVKGSPFPVVTNLLGSRQRICAALGIPELSVLTRRLDGLLARLSAGPLGALSSLEEFRCWAPRTVATGGCQEVVERAPPDLFTLPVLKSWPGDGGEGRSGRFITLPLVITRDPESGLPNCGIYRVELLGATTAAIHWGERRGGARHYQRARERGEPLPVAIVLGGDPALLLAAFLSLPEGVDEVQFAGFLRREPVETVRCLTNELLVPADAELVIEGVLVPGDTVTGGAFGNHTGRYVPGRTVPRLSVTALTRRRAPLYPATVVGPPPMEDCWLAKAGERLLLPLLQRELPEIVDICLPLAGIFHGCAVVSMVKEGAGHPWRVVDTLWESGLLGEGRIIVLVDGDVPVEDLSLVLWHLSNNVGWDRDLVVSGGGDVSAAGRIGIDATRKDAVSFGGKAVTIVKDPAIERLVDLRWREYGLP